MVNADKTNHVINKGDRIAQMVFIPYVAPKLTVVDALPESKRGVGGFGSTGE
jgi:dUTP pyrophosphatase